MNERNEHNELDQLRNMRPIRCKPDKQIYAPEGEERALSVLHLPGRRSLDALLRQREGLLAACGSCSKLNLPRNPRVIPDGRGFIVIEEMALCTPHGPRERWIQDLLEALAQMHACGWMHMDLKPEHLLFSGESWLLHDFDGAKPIGARFYERDITWAYAPPDVLWHIRADVSDDLYAAALMLYQLRSGGALPRERSTGLRRALPGAVKAPEAWGSEARRFFQRALAWRRGARFHSTQAFLEAFRQVERTWKAGE